MARTSDTRRLTREAAAQLVADGRLPHTVTVDQIYAAIGQGSRTTINDALKRWKAERAQADALAETLPPMIADAMCALWAAAVDQATQQFAQERATLTHARDTALAAVLTQTEARTQAEERLADLADQLAAVTAARETAQHALAQAEAARAAATAEAMTMRDALEQLRQEGQQQRADARAAHEAQATGHQAALLERDQAFRDELDRATGRLQQSEGHMLKQVDDARLAVQRSEARLAKAHEQNATLRSELAELRARAARDQQDLAATRDALTAAHARQADAEHENAACERALITATAQAEAAQRVIGTLEAALQRGRRGRIPPPAP